jgi:hypothetical protein
MKTYPFSKDSKENKFPKSGRSVIIKEVLKNENSHKQILIEFDLDVIKEYFPEADDRESQLAIIECILPSIVMIDKK